MADIELRQTTVAVRGKVRGSLIVSQKKMIPELLGSLDVSYGSGVTPSHTVIYGGITITAELRWNYGKALNYGP
jgi:hypothetical protein